MFIAANRRRQIKESFCSSSVWFWLAVAILILLLTLPLYSETFKTFISEAIGWAKDVMNEHRVTGAIVFFLFSACSALLAFTSSAVLVPPANQVWGKFVTLALLWGGWIAGAVVAFGIGSLAYPLLTRLGYKETLENYRKYVSKRMNFWAVLLFCIAVPSEVPGYLFGGLHYPFFKFIAAMSIAEFIYAVGLVVVGENLLSANPWPLLATVAILLLMAIAAGLTLKKVKKR